MTYQLSLLYTTFGSKETAIRISRDLLEQQLIACVNILEGTHSLYRWQGRVEENKETIALYKTTAEKVPALIAALENLHPYDVPTMLEIPINRANDTFLNWVQESVR